MVTDNSSGEHLNEGRVTNRVFDFHIYLLNTAGFKLIIFFTITHL